MSRIGSRDGGTAPHLRVVLLALLVAIAASTGAIAADPGDAGAAASVPSADRGVGTSNLTGPTAASMSGSSGLSVSADDSQIAVGETTTVSIVVDNVDGGVGSWNLTVTVNDSSVGQITSISSPANPASSDASIAADGSSAWLDGAFADTADNGSVTIVEVELEGVAAGTVTVSVDDGAPLFVTDELGSGYTLTSFGSDTITVTAGADGNGDGGNGDGANGGGSPEDDDAPVPLEDGRRYYIGQQLVRSEDIAAGSTLDIVHPDGSETLAFANDTGVVTIDTAGMAPGDYTLENTSGREIASFSLIRHEIITFEFNNDTVTNQRPNAHATLSIDTNRRPVVHYLRATSDGERVDPSTLQTALGMGVAIDTDDDGSPDAVRIEGTNADEFELDFSGVPAGELTLRTTVPDTEITASADITVRRATQGSAEFAAASKVIQVETYQTASILITYSNTQSATLTVGSNDLRWKVRLTVTDQDGDGSVTVKVNTANARRSGTTVSAVGPDSVSNVTTLGGGPFNDPNRRIAAEAYPMSLAVNGRETDLATLALQNTTTTSVCGRDASPLVQRYNENVDQLPGFVSGIVRDETIHGIVTDDSTGDYTIRTGSDKRVTDFQPGEPADPTVVVETDCQTFTSILDAQDVLDVFRQAYDNGEVSVRGTGIINSIVVEAIEIGVKIAQALGLL